MADIELENVTKRFPGGVVAVDDLDLHIADGEFFSLLGPSGCGKTTLLRMTAGLERASGGRISIGGQDVTRLPPGERDVAMVFQDYALYPHMQVVDNIAYPLKVRKLDKRERRQRAAEAASSLQLGEYLERRPSELSGGQQQRAAVARAIAYEPSVFLFDEPLSNLDARLRLEARTFLKRLQADLGVSTIYVTHDQSEALALSDRMAVMKDGQVRQLGAPKEVFDRPVELFVASFIGSVPMNLMEGRISEDGDHVELRGQRVPVPPAFAGSVGPNDGVVLGVRPEYGSLAAPETPQAITGRIAVSEFLGTQHLVTVEADGLSVQVVTKEAVALDDRVSVVFAPEQSLLYDPDSEQLLASRPVDGSAERVDSAHREG
ncbi:ABC transporter ATP-binding protein [Egibacter rhizosphaerae]|uniref:ABC transporter ATP-binding protein n=1 Tax=Egibacter rhizosphaerae TaxID=1670831 RepID=A0A411YI74_9ACTN|nr:ABC transporter ATP-binding protein [Egibacter rhizosphaerae]QBI20930.1 ABC transporter ATP-binding protein [Egibacter rhizosphaerae]